MKTKHLFLWFSFFVFSFTNAQNVTITIEDPEPMQICNLTTSKLKARVNFESNVQAATISVVLPEGINYVPGSITRTATNKPNQLKIQESDTKNPSKPFFKVTGKIEPADWIEFTIQKNANCLAYTTSSKKQNFTDQVTIQIGNETKTEKSSSYIVDYPVFSIKEQTTKNEAIPNKTYTRSFTITNGGTSFANAIYLDIKYDKDIQQQQKGLRLANSNGIKITEYSVNGNLHRYIINGNLLGSDQRFTNGETITLYEDYSIKACNTTTTYDVSWGCDEKNPCQTTTAIAQVNLIKGTPKMDTFYHGEIKNYVNSATPFEWSVTFTNTGTSNDAGAIYNTIFMLGEAHDGFLELYNWDHTNIIGASVGGIPVPGFTIMDKLGFATFDFVDKLTKEQVKGKEIGLRDIDGDGYVDDLPAGASITIDLKLKINNNVFSCDTRTDVVSYHYGVHGAVQYTTICEEKITTPRLLAKKGTNIAGTHIARLKNSTYVPTNIYDGKVFETRFCISYYLFNNIFDRPSTRYFYQIELPPELSLISGSEKWYIGQYPNNITTPLKPVVKQDGNLLTITSPDQRMGYCVANFVYKCTGNNKGGKIEMPLTLKRIENIDVDCPTCTHEIFCSTVTIENIICPAVCNSGGPSITFAKVERADNSLGYTDTNMKALQKRQNISDYDLSKALYLDDIEVMANAKPTATKQDLFLKFSIAKLGTNLKADRLQAKSFAYTIIRPGDPKSPYKGTLSIEEALTHTSDKKEEVFLWNLTRILPDGKIQAGDQIETKATYTVISNDMPQHDEQTGKEIYFYNTDSGGYELVCNKLVPEMYLVTAVFIDGSNSTHSVNGCEVKNIGDGASYLAYRFDSNGLVYMNEIRPGYLPQTYSFTLSDNLFINKVELEYYRTGKREDITSKLEKKGSTYTYYFKEEECCNILVTNDYNLGFYIFINSSCQIKERGQFVNSEFTYLPYWYHYSVRNKFPETNK